MIVSTASALVIFIGWTLALLIVMELLRTSLVLSKRIDATKFKSGNENLSPFMQRLARAHMNCIEGLPVFGGLLLVAIATSRTAITDPLAAWFILARLVQSVTHLISTAALAVNIRFTAFSIQMVIGAIWAWNLLAALR